MKTSYWILIGFCLLTVAVITTAMIVKKRTPKDEEEIIDETVERLVTGRLAQGDGNEPIEAGHQKCWICVKYNRNGCSKVKKVRCDQMDADTPHI